MLILDDVGWMQVFVKDRFGDLDVLVDFAVGFPNGILLVDADVAVEDLVVHLRNSCPLTWTHFRERTVDLQFAVARCLLRM